MYSKNRRTKFILMDISTSTISMKSKLHVNVKTEHQTCQDIDIKREDCLKNEEEKTEKGMIIVKEEPKEFMDPMLFDSIKLEPSGHNVFIKEEAHDIVSSESSNFSLLLDKQSQPSISGDQQHNKRFICIFCNKAYNYLSHLKKHMRTHSGEKPYACEVCCKNFRCKGTLKVHILTHTGFKPFKCDVCGKEFQTSSNLKKHNLVHTNEKPYTCNICQRSYRCITQMKNHRMLHLGEKKYKCSFCDEKFGYLISLKAHLLKHTGEVPPFKCDVCNKNFTMSHHLKRHKETHIGAPFICRKCNQEFLQLREMQKHSSDCRSAIVGNLDCR